MSGANKPNSDAKPDQQEKRKKESILELTKFLEKSIRVKFAGGREASGVLKGIFNWMKLKWYYTYVTVFSIVLGIYLQVNLCQRLSFLNQLTHNMTRDFSLNPPKNTSSEHVVYKYCFECQNKNKKTIFVHNMF